MTGDKRNSPFADELMNDCRRNGYCIVPYDIDNCLDLEKYIASLDYGNANENFIYSLLTFNTEINIEVSKRVTAFFKKSLPEFNSEKFVTGSFLIKPGNVLKELQLHQDWSYAFLEQQAPLTCWTPLTNTGANTGGIFLIKGSHALFKNYRSNSYNTSRFSISEFAEGVITYLEVKRGEILLFDPSIWHGSSVNNSLLPRIAVTCLMVPQSHNMLYFHKRDEENCEVYQMPEFGLETYLKYLIKDEIPDALKLLRTIPYHHTVPASSDLAQELTV